MTRIANNILTALNDDWSGKAEELCGYDEETDTFSRPVDVEGLRGYILELKRWNAFLSDEDDRDYREATEEAIQSILEQYEEGF